VAISVDEDPADASARRAGEAAGDGAIRVLYVEDDAFCREAVSGELGDQGFAVRDFGDGRELLAQPAAFAEADVIVLDWAMPGMPGLELLRELRQRGVDLPVVFLTGHGEIRHESLALERGAIDFVDKSRGVAILARRLRRAVRAAKPPPAPEPEERMVHGPLVLRPTVRRAYWKDADVGLTIHEFDVVHLLVSNAGRQISYRAIYDAVHYEGFIAGAGAAGYRTNVRSVIKRIRRKFLELDPAFVEIGNSAGVGYCWGPRSSQE